MIVKNIVFPNIPNAALPQKTLGARVGNIRFRGVEMSSEQSAAIRSSALPLLQTPLKKFKTTQEADKYLEEKYDIMSTFTNVNQANLVVSVVEDFISLSGDTKMFKNMQIWKVHPYYDDGRTIAQAGRYGIDLSETYDWDNHAEFVKKNYEETGFLASPDPKEVIYHEFMHYFDENSSPKRYRMLRDKIDSGKKFNPPEAEKSAAAQVSKYAMVNPLEFVAEYGAARMCGLKFSKDVDDLYEKYGGPKIAFP